MVKKILAIDGGGMYGVVPLAVCIAIEERLQKPLRDIFDLFVGTSTGSLISAAALSGLHHEGGTTTFGLSAQEIFDAYEEYGRQIFSAKRGNIEIPGLDVTLYPEYEADGIRTALNKVVGERRLNWLNLQPERERRYLSISAYNMSQGKPHFFRSWTNENVYIRDAVIASSLAPTVHPMYEVDGNFYTDGGVFAVNPASYALGDGLSIWPNESLVIVSLGTGIYEPALEPPDRPDKDIFFWLRNISKLVTDGQNESTHEVMTRIDKAATWLKYFRFNVNLIQKKKSDELDFDVLKQAHSLMGEKLNTDNQNEFNTLIQVLQQ